MDTWFECKITYFNTDENGKESKTTENYLLDAISFTEAEARLHEQMESIVSGGFIVAGIKKSNITEIHAFEAGEWWYKCKVVIIDIDEKSGKEKKASNYMLVMADTVKEAYERLEGALSEMLVPYSVNSIVESTIFDVFPYFEEGQKIPANLKPLTVPRQEKELETADNFEEEGTNVMID